MRKPLKGIAPDALLDAIFVHAPVGITIAEAPDVRIIRVSDFGAQMLRRPREVLEDIAVEKHVDAYRVVRHGTEQPAAPEELPLTRATQEGEVVRDEEWDFINEEGDIVTILCNAGPIFDRDGHLIGGIIAWTNISRQKQLEKELREALQAKEALIAESYHRVKNNLQIIASMIRIHTTKQQLIARDAEDLLSRIHVIGLVHDLFHGEGSAAEISAKEYVEKIVAQASSPERPVIVDIEGGLRISMQKSTPLGMFINEAVTNSLKYAYDDDQPGIVIVSGAQIGNKIEVSIRDWGRGLPNQMEKNKSMGLRLLDQLANQLGGIFTISNCEDGGVVASVTF
jgi:two-component sensor histidine kinase